MTGLPSSKRSLHEISRSLLSLLLVILLLSDSPEAIETGVNLRLFSPGSGLDCGLDYFERLLLDIQQTMGPEVRAAPRDGPIATKI